MTLFGYTYVMDAIKHITKEWKSNDLIDVFEQHFLEKEISDPEVLEKLENLRSKYAKSKENTIYGTENEISILLTEIDAVISNELLSKDMYNWIFNVIQKRIDEQVRESREKEVNWIESPSKILKEVTKLAKRNKYFKLNESYVWNSNFIIVFVPQIHHSEDLFPKEEINWEQVEEPDYIVPQEMRDKELNNTKVQDHITISRIAQSQWEIYKIAEVLLDSWICNTYAIEWNYSKAIRVKSVNWGQVQGVNWNLYPWFLKSWITALSVKESMNISIQNIESENVNQLAIKIHIGLYKLTSNVMSAYTISDLVDYLWEEWAKQLIFKTVFLWIWKDKYPDVYDSLYSLLFSEWVSMLTDPKFLNTLRSEIRAKYVFSDRNEDSLKNLLTLQKDTWSKCVSLIYGQAHFDANNWISFQELCREKWISYMVVSPQSHK